MPAVRGRAKAAAILATTAALIGGTAMTAHALAPGTGLMAAPMADRSGAVSLPGATVGELSYLFLVTGNDVNDVNKVTFYIDDKSATGDPISVDRSAPFDVGGTDIDGTANPLDLSDFDDGPHALTAYAETDKVIFLYTVNFKLQKGLTPAAQAAPKSAPKSETTMVTQKLVKPTVTEPTTAEVPPTTKAPEAASKPVVVPSKQSPPGQAKKDDAKAGQTKKEVATKPNRNGSGGKNSAPPKAGIPLPPLDLSSPLPATTIETPSAAVPAVVDSVVSSPHPK